MQATDDDLAARSPLMQPIDDDLLAQSPLVQATDDSLPKQKSPSPPSPEPDMSDGSDKSAGTGSPSVDGDNDYNIPFLMEEDAEEGEVAKEKAEDEKPEEKKAEEEKVEEKKAEEEKVEEEKVEEEKVEKEKVVEEVGDEEIEVMAEGGGMEMEDMVERGENRETLENTVTAVAEEEDEESDGEALSEGEYVVEAIRGDRKRDNRVQYLIKWKGYSEAENTWENQDNVNADELIAKYMLEKKEKKAPSTGGRRKRTASNARKGAANSRQLTIGASYRSRTMQPREENNADDSSDTGRRRKTRVTDRTKDSSNNNVVASARGRTGKTWPPIGMTSWEDSVLNVEAVEQSENGELIIILKWKNGYRTAHSSMEANKMCPQKVIKFYEDHLRFRTVECED